MMVAALSDEEQEIGGHFHQHCGEDSEREMHILHISHILHILQISHTYISHILHICIVMLHNAICLLVPLALLSTQESK